MTVGRLTCPECGLEGVLGTHFDVQNGDVSCPGCGRVDALDKFEASESVTLAWVIQDPNGEYRGVCLVA